MLLDKTEQETREELYNDPKTVSEQLEEIYHDKTSKWHQAYWNNTHPLHRQAVDRVSFLSAAKIPGSEVEVMPVVTHSAPNAHQSEEE